MEKRTYISQIPDLLTDHGWMKEHLVFEARMGSHMYGVGKDSSDVDVRGVFVPPREMLFPFEKGNYIYGFGTQPLKYEVFDKNFEEFDVVYYSIVKVFDLLMSNNPNAMPVLFYPLEKATIATDVIRHMQSKRNLFLSKKMFRSYNGLAEKMLTRAEEGKKAEKHMYLGLRFLSELHDMASDPSGFKFDGNRELLSEVRNGRMDFNSFTKEFDRLQLRNSLLDMNKSYQEAPNELEVRNLLWECLEIFYRE